MSGSLDAPPAPTPSFNVFRSCLLLLGLIPLAGPTWSLPAQADWVALAGGPGTPGNVWKLAPGQAQGTPVVGLEGIELLPADFVGRTRIGRFLPDRPRREPLGENAARLVLPQDRGSLFAYKKVAASGSTFGWFLVEPGGDVRILFEALGTGIDGQESPLQPFVACDAEGTCLLLATTPAAGGNLIEVELGTGATTDRTESRGPETIHPQSLVLATDFGLAVTPSGPLRFARSPGAQVADVNFPAPTPHYFADGVVRSQDRGAVGLLAGSGPHALRVWTVDALGVARPADMPEARIEGPGFLPQVQDGPYLALSFDGSVVGYRATLPKPAPEPGTSREVFRASVAPTGGPIHATSDALFLDTIDEIGVLRFLPGGQLLFGAGAVGDTTVGSIEALDLYRVDGSGQVENLSQSSGDGLAPFGSPGQLDPEEGLYEEPGTSRFLLHDSQSGGTGRLVTIDASGGSSVLQSGVKSLDSIAFATNRFVVAVRRDVGGDRVEVASIGGPGGFVPLAALPEGTVFDPLLPLSTGTVGARMAFGTGQWIVRFDALSGGGELLTPTPLPYAPSFGATSSGAFRFSTPAVPGLVLGWSGSAAVEFAFGPDEPLVVLPAL